MSTRLQLVGDGIWAIHHPHRVMRVFPLGHRMTVLRQPDGGLVLHSPVPFDDELARRIDELGPVRHVLAPSRMHNLFLEPWLAHYRDATSWAVADFAADNPTVRVDARLDGETEIAGLRCVAIDGMPKVNECVVVHMASRSLIVADLVFHFPTTDSLALALLLRLNGAYGKLAVSRLFRTLVKDRRATRESIDRVLACDFDRLIVGHGVNIDTGARQRLRDAWSWLS